MTLILLSMQLNVNIWCDLKRPQMLFGHFLQKCTQNCMVLSCFTYRLQLNHRNSLSFARASNAHNMNTRCFQTCCCFLSDRNTWSLLFHSQFLHITQHMWWRKSWSQVITKQCMSEGYSSYGCKRMTSADSDKNKDADWSDKHMNASCSASWSIDVIYQRLGTITANISHLNYNQ